MKCVFVSCFNIYDLRIKPIETFLKSKGYECHYITSNYDHNKKSEYKTEREDSIQLNVLKYKKNLSFMRLFSHFLFANRAFKEVEKIKPDLVYVIIPPNFLAWYFSKYKSKHSIKLVFDIYDLWPETFPSKRSKTLLSMPFYFWRELRNKNLASADLIITECNLFQTVLEENIKDIKTDTLYLSKDNFNNVFPLNNYNLETIQLCYLGSINNIIDIQMIKKIIDKISRIRPVVFHIIGDGESRDILIKELESTQAEIIFYGKIYSQEEKNKIFSKCHYGINIMKESVCVGLTMKSIDYFQSNLPILNNIPADTSHIVEKYSVGFNIHNNNMDEVINKIALMSEGEYINMRKNTNTVFNKYFSTQAANENLEVIYKKIGT